MRTATCSLIASLAFAAAGMAHAQQAPAAADHPLTRAEVLADLEIWQRAGLNELSSFEGYADVSLNSDYQQRLAVYRQLRSGPAYAEAVARLSGRASERVAAQ